MDGTQGLQPFTEIAGGPAGLNQPAVASRAKLQRVSSKQAAQPSPLTLEGMRQHLQRVFIGYRPGDPTVGCLPAHIPQPQPPAAQPVAQAAAGAAPMPAVAKAVNLRQWSMQQLLQEAATTRSRDPFLDLLSDPPGVPADRIAYITGQEPARRRVQSGHPTIAAETATPPALPAGKEGPPLTPEAVAAAAAVATVAAAAAAAAAAPETTKPAALNGSRPSGPAAAPTAAPPSAGKKRRRQRGSLSTIPSAAKPESEEGLLQGELSEAQVPLQPMQQVVSTGTEVYAEPPPLDVAALQAALAMAQGGLSGLHVKQE